MIDTQIKSRLYDEIEKVDRPRDRSHWHASDLAKCPRATFMQRHGVPTISKPGAGKRLRWDAGFAFEDVIRPHLKKLYPLMDSNISLVSNELDLIGEYDNYDKVTKTLIEIKTVDIYAFKEGESGTIYLKEADGKNVRGQNSWKPKQTPYLHHELQNHTYVILLDILKGEKVKNVIYVYIDLRGRMAVYNTKVEDKYVEAVKRRLAVLNEAWASGNAPECVCQEDQPLWAEVNQWCEYKTEDGCCELNLMEGVK